MTDFADDAAAAEESFRAKSIAKARANLSDEPWREASAKWCEAAGCGERIPDLRRRAIPGVKLCVTCQAENERRRG